MIQKNNGPSLLEGSEGRRGERSSPWWQMRAGSREIVLVMKPPLCRTRRDIRP